MGTAERHEARLLWSSNPLLYGLLQLSRVTGPMRRLPRLGWVVTDPVIARRLLGDDQHLSLLGEGGVGHLWAQVLGDWVNDTFDGLGHSALRAKGRDLFTDGSARRQVERVFAGSAAQLTQRLRRGDTVDVAELARTWVGRMVADLLGLDVDAGDSAQTDRNCRDIFARGERLAVLARRTIGSTQLPADVVAEGRAIIEQFTAGVPRAYESAGEDTLLGRCRVAGIPLREARGIASVLLVAGTETAASAMGRGVALLHDTGQQDLLRDDRALLPHAVREILRVTTPAPLIGRHVSAPLEVAGHAMQEGERVLMLTYRADNAVGGFDVRRPPEPSIRQLWFGAGKHLCLGAPLARAEVSYLLTTLLDAGTPWHVMRRRAARGVVSPRTASC